MRRANRPGQRRGPSAVVAAATMIVVLALVGAAVTSTVTAGDGIDVGEARAKLAAFVSENGLLPPGSDVPLTGPPCPLATVEQIGQAAAATTADGPRRCPGRFALRIGQIPSAVCVWRPVTPSTVNPLAIWKSTTADSVIGP